MTQQADVLPQAPSLMTYIQLIARPHMVEGEKQPAQAVLWPQAGTL